MHFYANSIIEEKDYATRNLIRWEKQMSNQLTLKYLGGNIKVNIQQYTRKES